MGRIVVGVDGSEPSKAAVAWARAEAHLRGATLEVICAYRLPAGWLGMGEAMGATLPVAVTESDVSAYAESTLDVVLADAPTDGTAEGAAVETIRRALPGHAAQVLVAASADADLLVVGSRGHGDVGSLLLGSVGLHCVHHATCPVVVVHGPARDGRDG